ncbi:MAG: hypothetical protein J07HQW2_02216 [Haloquadratum walsbyi J07HQW2]|uniref:Uncharacterized protein n=1 Tax=Haloquadratum walsbyi J07HQW2 TaxID=1238425 RepID=U1PTP5_9EURY|nr:MAG: hypothetical protein J07HQW2_02216 [Haloquadratum walsbyi J07HQW2]
MYTNAPVLSVAWLRCGEAGPQSLKEVGGDAERLTNRRDGFRRVLVNTEDSS